VTGSRKWNKSWVVHFELARAFLFYGPFALVHGDCPTGADADARHWFEVAGQFLDCREERHPADWVRHGKAAGPIRNIEMVKAGADLVLAYPLPGGSGTQHTIDLARKAGIEVRIWGDE
jgi:hypothetical protein